MPLPKLQIVPSQDGYAASFGNGAVIRTRVGGGPSRFRLDMLGAPHIVNVTLKLDRTEYQYWQAFYGTTIVEGSLPFLVDLLLDHPELQEYEAHIVPDSVQLAGIEGLRHVITAQLEVESPSLSETDEAIAMLYELYGLDAPLILELLAELVNVDLPEIDG